ncbi:MAG: VWA domain-containing protein [Candidatus Heimdallarchaeaceae archaeon]
MIYEDEVKEIWKNQKLMKILYKPRAIPFEVRKRVIEILNYELYTGEHYDITDWEDFKKSMKSFSLILIYLHKEQYWQKIIEQTKENKYLVLKILLKLLPFIFDIMEDYELSWLMNENSLKRADEHPKEEKYGFEFLKNVLQISLNEWVEEEEIIHPKSKTLNSLTKLKDKETSILKNDVNLTKLIDNCVSNKRTMQMLDYVIKTTLIEEFEWVKKNLRFLELLEYLYPDSLWDSTRSELHNEYFSNLLKYAKMLEYLPELERIVELLGRIEIEAGQKQRIAKKGPTEIHGITLSGNIERVLVPELLKLLKPHTKKLFFAKMVEKGLLSYKLQGKYWFEGIKEKTSLKRGPVVVLIDTSGSMAGFPEEIAKAITLEIARKMIKEKRMVKVILFSSRDEIKEFEIAERKKLNKEFLEFLSFLSFRFGGGTDFNTALKAGLNAVNSEKFEKADLLFISDGISEIDDKGLLKELDDWKNKKEGRVFTVAINCDDAGGLEKISDYVYLLKTIGSNLWVPEDSPAFLITLISSKKIKSI